MTMNPQNRLRNSFAEVVKRQAGELAELARDAQADPDVREALSFELDRIGGTAASLGLTPIERAAKAALAAGDDEAFLEMVERLVDACRALEGVATLFRPVIVVGVEAPDDLDLAVDLRAAADVPEALALAEAEDPSAFVVPHDQLDEIFGRLEGALKAVPVYACGPARELPLRLEAARKGAAGFVGTPVRLHRVLDLVRARAREADPPPYRVLLVESEDETAAVVTDALDGPNRVVRRVTRAGELLETMDDFGPELILLAAQGEDFDGASMASVVHGHDIYGGVPVLFLARERDLGATALVAGADDIIQKPVSAPQLRARVLARLRRTREAEAARVEDRLTGVLSRRALLRLADREIGLARRTGNPLSVVLVDVDSMGDINASLGLGRGDDVLRAMSRMLLTTFRETDVVGRVGGDSFAILLPACPAKFARRRIDSMRNPLRSWGGEQGVDELEISVGVADTINSIADVLARADRALLQARNEGGGRTCVDGEPVDLGI